METEIKNSKVDFENEKKDNKVKQTLIDKLEQDVATFKLEKEQRINEIDSLRQKLNEVEVSIISFLCPLGETLGCS